jgi:hypothetical protein
MLVGQTEDVNDPRKTWRRQVPNIGGRDIQTQTTFAAELFLIAT